MEFPEKFIIRKFVAIAGFQRDMAIADLPSPSKAGPLKRYCTPIKDGEYWAMGLPVIITKDISDDSDIIRQEQIGYVLQELNESEYLQSVKVIETLIGDPVIRARIVQVANKYRSFEIARNVYRHVYLNKVKRQLRTKLDALYIRSAPGGRLLPITLGREHSCSVPPHLPRETGDFWWLVCPATPAGKRIVVLHHSSLRTYWTIRGRSHLIFILKISDSEEYRMEIPVR